MESNKKSYVKNINSTRLALNHAKQNSQELQEQKTLELQKKHASVTLKKEELAKQIDALNTTIQSISQEIHNSVKSSISVYGEELQSLESNENNQINKIIDTCSTRVEETYTELSNVLQRNGVDKVLLESISVKMKNLSIVLEQIAHNKDTVIVYNSVYKEKFLRLPLLDTQLRSEKQILDDLKSKRIEIKKNNKLEEEKLQKIRNTLEGTRIEIENFTQSYAKNIQNQNIEKKIQDNLSLDTYTLDENVKISSLIVDEIIHFFNAIKSAQESIKSSVQDVIRNLKSNNIFKIEIPNDFVSTSSYLKTAKELIEYIKNDKLSLFKDASLDKFKSSINSITKQLNFFEEALLDVEGEVQSLANGIRKAIDSFVVINDISIRYQDANNLVLNTLQSLIYFYENNNDKFLSGLFDSKNSDVVLSKAREELREKIIELVELLHVSKEYLELEHGFVLEFKVVEKGNDLKWRQSLDDIGSNGTSTLVKSIINISMLKMVRKNIVKNYEITTHCILDEIGTISTEYFKELKNFVNESGFVFLNGMPTEDDMLISMYPNIYVGQNFGKYSKMTLVSKMEI
ncbi:ATP-binding protein [Sulfurimonas sp. SAG-AH-194-I05]|nr:ATP-binding protein [Sulfurimonas sp. SAG-AH-194-I05]